MLSATRHPSYNAGTLSNDIAVLRLGAKLSFTDKIRPVKVATARSPTFAGEQGTVTGWGTTRSGGSASDVLREVS